MPPHYIDHTGLDERCVQLYALVTSPYPSGDSEYDTLADHYAGFYRYKISELLLDISIRCRVLDDMFADDEECNMAGLGHIPGVAEYRTGGTGELKLREVVNKIIHADQILLVFDGEEDEWQDADYAARNHTGKLQLRGKKHDAEWEVVLCPVAFVRQVLIWHERVQEFGRLHKMYP